MDLESIDSVEDLLSSADEVIEGIYRDFNIIPSHRSSIGNDKPFASSSDDGVSNASSESNPNRGSSSVCATTSKNKTTTTKSPMTPRNMEAEIEKINRICDNVDQNLRSIGVFMNNSVSGRITENVLNTDLATPTPSSSTTELSLNQSAPPLLGCNSENNSQSSKSPRVSQFVDLSNTQRYTPERITQPIPNNNENNPQSYKSPRVSQFVDLSNSQTYTPERITQLIPSNNENNLHSKSPRVSQFVDLSNSQTYTPERITQQIPNNNDGDNDVILVSEHIPIVVNLCTPIDHHEIPRSRSSINYQLLNRRRLAQYDDDVVGRHVEGSSSARKRRVTYTPSKYKTLVNKSNAEKESNIETSSETNDNGVTPFMCPVCMESCLQRQPTSTICGHIFCGQCIEHAIALTHKCPMCNKKISKRQTFRIYI